MTVAAVTLLVVMAVVLVATGEDDGQGGTVQDVVRVSMTEFAFSPDPIVVDRDAAVFDVVNDGEVAHNLLIGALGKGAPDLGPGEAFELDLTDQPAGTYRVVCDLPGHTEAGMVTELTLR